MASIRCCNVTTNSGTICGSSSPVGCPVARGSAGLSPVTPLSTPHRPLFTIALCPQLLVMLAPSPSFTIWQCSSSPLSSTSEPVSPYLFNSILEKQRYGFPMYFHLYPSKVYTCCTLIKEIQPQQAGFFHVGHED
ncbi:hypothetical protein E2C01_025430 [Portunus trituberculatus]|uniref:Uncharacterized protein n=1 Tax=Portunus trituberculatus TaxID=210409 RepID=A0A5B7EFX4_PORTR|nr:hypothetical protein [Portunus trituberculatus]